MARSTRKIWLTVMGVFGIAIAFVAAAALSRRLFETPAPPVVSQPTRQVRLDGDRDPERFRVTGLQGPVEIVQQDRVYVLTAGDFLSLQDVIRTPPGARAIVRRGSTEIEIRENVQIRLEELANHTARFGIVAGDGDVAASVSADNERLAISTDRTESVNDGASRWVVARTEAGKVSVAVARGQVRFRAANQEVQVPAGSESVAFPGQPPSPPTALSEDLLLSVIWPDQEGARETVHVRGRTRPSSRVTINGQRTDPNPDGEFSAEIPLRMGPNRIEVKATDSLGRSRADVRAVDREPPRPRLETTPEDLWDR